MDLSDGAPALAPPDHAPDEITALTQFLDLYRTVLLRKAWGLDGRQLATTLPPSSLTLGGLLKHMAFVEDDWFDHDFLGAPPREPWASAPWDDDRDWEFASAVNDSPDELIAMFTEACDRSRATVGAAASLDEESALPDRDGGRWNLRWIMVHMIEEYARHCGHADLIRQSIDGHVDD